jgi:rRNA-processing protein FCF1
MKTIILDTSFILNAIEAHIDIFREIERISLFKYKIAIIDKTIEELEKIIMRGGKTKYSAQLAKKIIDLKKIDKIMTRSKKSVDDLILENSNQNTIVATMDAELKRKLRQKSISLMVIRSRSHLQMV